MATYKYVEVQMKEAEYLADLNGIQIDLQTTIDLCNCLMNVEYKDRELPEALSIAILVKYNRCFAKGVRARLSIEAVPGLTEAELEQHNYFIALRNKHIAHSVNEFEQNKVKAYYNDEKVYDEGISSIGLGHATLFSIGGNDANKIIQLTRKIIDYVNDEIKIEKAKILALLRNRPIIEVLSLGSSVFNPNMGNVDKRRK